MKWMNEMKKVKKIKEMKVMKKGRFLYFIFLLFFILCFLIIFAPLIKDSCQDIANSIYYFFSFLCHQIPERCFSIKDITFGFIKNENKLPVCSRDFGFYLSALIGLSLCFFIDLKKLSKKIYIVFVIAILPLAIDGITQILGLRESTNLIRFLTGIFAGFSSAIFLVYLLEK